MARTVTSLMVFYLCHRWRSLLRPLLSAVRRVLWIQHNPCFSGLHPMPPLPPNFTHHRQGTTRHVARISTAVTTDAPHDANRSRHRQISLYQNIVTAFPPTINHRRQQAPCDQDRNETKKGKQTNPAASKKKKVKKIQQSRIHRESNRAAGRVYVDTIINSNNLTLKREKTITLKPRFA